MSSQPLLTFDRATGLVSGAGAWQRGYISRANLSPKMTPGRIERGLARPGQQTECERRAPRSLRD
ncbi:MAG: hypothetical protein JWP21_840 [Tardiphaga sp.]|nr:hypothetical protein [Tardiphaga sp.]